ncbi:hypothetical protein K7432_004012 [Basidiobolus ranarum]|uniref:C2H2-type domain-containing protein n=1 Tax=Basidiobolus ranarum TaxID=34480 RepID=A0ABR2W5T6_9FUNG
MSSSPATTNDESASDCTLPSIHQLNPEVSIPFQSREASQKDVDKSISSPPILFPPPTLMSQTSTENLSERMSIRCEYSRSPSRSEYGQSSKASSDSEEERALKTPANDMAALESDSQPKDEGSHMKHAYVCPYTGCGWSFKRYEHLKRHQLVHTKERPYVCEYPSCGKSFSRSDNYSAHYRTHQRRKSLIETNPFSSIEGKDVNLQSSRLVHRRCSLAIGDETRATRFKLESLDVPTIRDVEEPLPSPSKTSNIHQLLNGSEPHPTGLYPRKRRYSEHTLATSQDPDQEKPTKISNWGRAERRHSIAIMTSMPTNFGASHSPSGHQSSHTLPPNVIHHLYPHPNIRLLSHSQSLTNLPRHSYSHPHSQGQPLAFLTNHFTHIHSIVGMPLATIAESPSHHIPTTTTAPRTSGTKNHVCTVAGCNMRFKRLEHLKRHMRVHTLERPFACTFIGCRKTFSRRDNLGQHMRTHERQALKQVQNTSVIAPSTTHSTSVGLGIGHAGHVRQRSM